MSTVKQAVLASSNKGKLREMGDILAGIGIELLPQSRFNVLWYSN